MKHEMQPPPQIDREAWLLAVAIARAIRVSRDEGDAIRRICTLLDIWEVKITPGDLGSRAQPSSLRSGETPSP